MISLPWLSPRYSWAIAPGACSSPGRISSSWTILPSSANSVRRVAAASNSPMWSKIMKPDQRSLFGRTGEADRAATRDMRELPNKTSDAAGCGRDQNVLARLRVAKSVKGEVGGEPIDAEQAQIRAERQGRRLDAAQHRIRRRDAMALPAKPAIDKFAGTKFRCVAFEDLADGERAHRRVQRHRRTVVPLVVGPSALRRINREIAILDQDLALADCCHRLRHQRKVFGLRYPTRPRHEPDLSV